jgi:hypothetical protein
MRPNNILLEYEFEFLNLITSKIIRKVVKGLKHYKAIDNQENQLK